MNGMQQNKKERHSRVIRLWLIVILSCMLIYGSVVLIRYGIDWISERSTEAELKEIYYSSDTADPAPEPSDDSEKPGEEMNDLPGASAENTVVPEPEYTETEAVRTAAGILEAVPYPDNPKQMINNRFQELRKKNRDIIGWLKLDGLLDQAVVQRDHSFYMDHDAMKKKNQNGAIFLDAAVSLKTRPWTLLLYGHNMKSGAMFGCLRNYENQRYYMQNPFLSFDSIYEEGRYVIFAAGRIGIEKSQPDYIDVFMMLSDKTEERRELIGKLQEASVFTCMVDVQPEDQLLLLVTCVDHDDRRRVVAARRLRAGETETELLDIIQADF